jgi:hypothetical protein
MSSFGAMWAPVLFGLALFLGSALLFVVQPMLGRTLLPHLRGNPVAWNACLVFFQATLLAGYLYANLVHRFRGVRWQPWLYLLLLGGAVTLCYCGIFGERLLTELAPRLTSLESWPVLTTLCLLIVVIGVPFLAMAALSPLLQRWFAHLEHPKASDPYFLLVASNLGGLTALVIYPLLIEPYAPLYAQWMSWQLAVTALGVVVFLAALVVWQSPRNPELEPAEKPSDPNAPVVPRLIGRGPATWPRCFYWLFASALPVGLLMGVTDYLTLDVAPAPILWTLPLALYLIAFSQSFGRFSPLELGTRGAQIGLHLLLGVASAIVVFILVAVLLAPAPRDGSEAVVAASCLFFAMLWLVPFSWLPVLQPISALIVVFAQASLNRQTVVATPVVLMYLTCYYLSVRLCLGMLASDRPAAPALTSYFTWIGLGGLCGGLFQVLLAPLLFQRSYLEFSLLAALAAIVRPAYTTNGLTDWLLCLIVLPKKDPADERVPILRGRVALVFDIVVGLLAAGMIGAALFFLREQAWGSTRLDLAFIGVLIFAAVLWLRPLRFGLALAAVVALSFIGSNTRDKVVVQQRTPFGILRVTELTQEIPERPNDPAGLIPRRFTQRTLLHANINHGFCITEPPELLRYPTAYYHRKGPVGQVMRTLEWFPEPANNLRQNGARFWLQKNRDNAKDDARIIASLVGMAATPASPVGVLPVAWSEPPYACVGLGVGSLLTYAHPFQPVDVYELDPAVIALSTDKAPGQAKPVFHYFQSALERGVHARIIPGDARRNLARPGHDGYYHAIFVDAFSSDAVPVPDAVPVHLLTQEAIEIYFQKLAPNGVVCFHTSNRYVDLPGVLDNIARKANLSGMHLRTDLQDMRNRNDPFRDEDVGFLQSNWFVLARNPEALRRWTANEAFNRPPAGNHPFNPRLAWTDQDASVLAAVPNTQRWPNLIYALLIMMLFFGIFLGMIEIAYAMRLPTKPKHP